jgi:hypothetical protein
MLHGVCEQGTLVRLDPWGDVLLTKAADCQMVTSKVIIDTINKPFALPLRPAPRRHWIYIMNFVQTEVQVTLYIGGRDVTVADGYPITNDERVILEVSDDIKVYGITNVLPEPPGELDVRILELV